MRREAQAGDGKAVTRCFIALQFGVPGVLLALRLWTGEMFWYGAGWQMFSG